MLKVDRSRPYDVGAVFKKCVYSSEGYSLPYRIYIPKNYDCGEKYPLLVFLHGAGERGDDNDAQLVNFMQDAFNDMKSPIYDSIVVAPQCPKKSQWVLTPFNKGCYSVKDTPESRELECVIEIIDHCRDFYNVDDDRIYAAGLSMGGYGTWDLLSRHGSRFAAGLPICGGGDPEYARLLKRIPIWTFHGSDDDAVPVRGTRKMFAEIKMAGGEQISYTEYDGRGHNIWNIVATDPDPIRWLYSQSREERRLKAEKQKKLKTAAALGGAGAILSVIAVLLGVKKKKK